MARASVSSGARACRFCRQYEAHASGSPDPPRGMHARIEQDL